ncbi:hypothetical protein AGDE_12896 [Angomonas deanei]|uniref:C3H1-type domain-containing protein n=1 Tax=Angomonas deanei TaxID=59799 RepID=A0A7G2C3W4_9TRYP|nr:hypothetical protein AGDE_12896 [Angomonas deanei]CAD2213407.1 hypothetical protein, conserved [Angomonas deanei]|eukprot:EPY23318.1 hypothetical protein AGDE_12896 [Angomonas deanei]
MKLCLNWKAGSCHSHAACTFAHVNNYFNVAHNNPAPIANPNTNTPTATTTATTTTTTTVTPTPATVTPTATTNSNNHSSAANTGNNHNNNNNNNSSHTNHVERSSTPPRTASNNGGSWVSLVASGRTPEAKGSATHRGLPPQSSWGARQTTEGVRPAEEGGAPEVESGTETHDAQTASAEPSNEQSNASQAAEPFVGFGADAGSSESPLQWLRMKPNTVNSAATRQTSNDHQQIKLRLLQELTGEPVPLSSMKYNQTQPSSVHNNYAQLLTGGNDNVVDSQPVNNNAIFYALTGGNGSGGPVGSGQKGPDTNNPMHQLMSLLTSDN